MQASKNILKEPGILLALCVVVFYAGWAKFTLSGYSIYLADYALRIFLCAMTVALGGLTFRVAEYRMQWAKMALVSAVILALVLLSYKIYRAYYVPVPLFGLPVASFPDIENRWLSWLDLSLGMVLVALSEEYVFRYLFARAIPKSPVLLYVLSSLAFGFLHAPQGLGLVIEATVAGALLMWLYRTTGTITAPVMVHFLTDAFLFSGIGCPYGIGDC